MMSVEGLMYNYCEASAAVELVVPSVVSSDVGVRLQPYYPLVLLPICREAAVRMLDNRFRRSSARSQWGEYGSAVRRLNHELESGTRLVLGSSLLRDSRQSQKEAEVLAKAHDLEMRNARQLQHLKRALEDDPLGTLLTASDLFERAAAREGLRVWHCARDPQPPAPR